LNSIKEIVEKLLSFLNPGAGGAVSGSGYQDGPERSMELESSSDEDPPATPDWDDRVLCPDGSCIGIIGPDGRCTACGRTSEAIGNAVSVADEESEASSVPEPFETDAAAIEDTPEAEEPPGGDWDDRVLCPDGSCIGVIGPDGRCTECGKGSPE
jgi:uncharacterized membrane protein